MSLTKEDLKQVEEMIIKVLKNCENIGHNWEICCGGLHKVCSRCNEIIFNYESGF